MTINTKNYCKQQAKLCDKRQFNGLNVCGRNIVRTFLGFNRKWWNWWTVREYVFTNYENANSFEYKQLKDFFFNEFPSSGSIFFADLNSAVTISTDIQNALRKARS